LSSVTAGDASLDISVDKRLKNEQFEEKKKYFSCHYSNLNQLVTLVKKIMCLLKNDWQL
jgi:hypothetical protein